MEQGGDQGYCLTVPWLVNAGASSLSDCLSDIDINAAGSGNKVSAQVQGPARGGLSLSSLG